MGCVSCANNENETNLVDLQFQEKHNDTSTGSRSKSDATPDRSKFIQNFEEKLKYIGEYIPVSDFDSLIPENANKYMIENCLDLGEYIPKNQVTYELKPVEFKNGNIYHGNWNDKCQMEGYGKYYLKDDKVLAEGVWDQGELKYARVFLPNGDIYEGDIKNSTFNGKGKLTSITGEIYDGDFVDGVKNGYGKIIFPDKTEYIGDICKTGINGRGSMKWTNGIEYQGNFKGCTLSGQGLLYNEQGEKYEGEFDKNLFNGKGKYTHTNGDVYDGDFEIGIRKGKGVYTKGDGTNFIFEGGWDNNLPNGFGKIILGNTIVKSTWRNGKIAEVPEYEKGNEVNINQLNFVPQEMNLTTKGLSNIGNVDVLASQYQPGSLPSFLDE